MVEERRAYPRPRDATFAAPQPVLPGRRIRSKDPSRGRPLLDQVVEDPSTTTWAGSETGQSAGRRERNHRHLRAVQDRTFGK